MYVIVNYLKTCQHYFKTHKTKIFMNDVSLKYFETQLKAITKRLLWHDSLIYGCGVEPQIKLRQCGPKHPKF